METLDFIKDRELKSTLEGSVEYLYVLYEQSKDKEQKELFSEETRRVMILYVVSVIEAILLYVYKRQDGVIEKNEYKFVKPLPETFSHSKKKECPVVVAVQEKVEKKDHEIGLHELVRFFKSKGLMREDTMSDILEMNDVRNTFHFSKPRRNSCSINRVEKAMQLLVYTIERAPKALKVRS